MTLPKKEYVLIRKRGRRTSYFYGPKLGDLVTAHLKIGEKFRYGFYVLQMRASVTCERSSASTYKAVYA
jgi:hypothetical protein